MKQKDIALVIVVVVVSMVFSFFVSKALFGSPKTKQQEAEVVQPITSSFPAADSRYYNHEAFDPTKPITIGQNGNSAPFSAQ